MIKTFEFGKGYSIHLSELYGSTKLNVEIIGETTIENVTKNKDGYNIYQTFFEPIGLGLTSYYTAIQDDSVIFICNPIKSFIPYKLDTDKIFIPKTLIDFNSSEEYVKVSNMTVKISPIVQKFDDEASKNEYISSLESKTKTILQSMIDYSNLDSEVSVSSEDLYITKEDLDAIIKSKNESYEKYKERLIKMEDTQNSKNASYIRQLLDYKKAQIACDAKIKEYNVLMDKLRVELDFYEDWHASVTP